MSKQLRPSLSFVVMTSLVFIYVSFFHSITVESQDGVDSFWNFHWITIHRHITLDEKSSVYSFDGFRFGVLLLEIFISICLTWLLSKLLARLRKRREQRAA